jgi:hypothetical protein
MLQAFNGLLVLVRCSRKGATNLSCQPAIEGFFVTVADAGGANETAPSSGFGVPPPGFAPVASPLLGSAGGAADGVSFAA